MPGLAIDEFRKYGGEQDDRLGVGDAHHEPIQHGPAPALVSRHGGGEGGQQPPAVADRADPQPHQVGRAYQLHHRERHRGPLHQRPDPERHANGDHLDSHGISHDGRQGRPPAVGERAAHDEQHAGTRDHDQDERRHRECHDLPGRHHARTLTLVPPNRRRARRPPGDDDRVKLSVLAGFGGDRRGTSSTLALQAFSAAGCRGPGRGSGRRPGSSGRRAGNYVPSQALSLTSYPKAEPVV